MKSSSSYSANAPAPTIAIIGFACFVIAVVALYFLNPSYTLANSMVGDYDLEAYEFLIASTFFALVAILYTVGRGVPAKLFGMKNTRSITIADIVVASGNPLPLRNNK